ncbi:MAG TPA: carbonic anhydrase [Gemmatimonadales bacterium]|nr:carbonic anhydrase [Gemmatimonadales bacterium]
MPLDDLLDQNRRWAEARRARDPEFFARLAAGQRPRLLWIGCSDSRVPAEEILGCGPGEVFVHRNVANVVASNDINIASVIQYATVNLGIADVVVCGHYGCGGILAACAHDLPDGYLGDWLNLVGDARRTVDRDVERDAGLARLTPEAYHHRVVEANVRLQIAHLAELGLVRRLLAARPGALRLHGWVYDIGTGLVKIVVPGDT